MKRDKAMRYTLRSMANSGKNAKAVVLLSGGMDSCVTAAIARLTHDVGLVHASYGQRTEFGGEPCSSSWNECCFAYERNSCNLRAVSQRAFSFRGSELGGSRVY